MPGTQGPGQEAEWKKTASAQETRHSDKGVVGGKRKQRDENSQRGSNKRPLLHDAFGALALDKLGRAGTGDIDMRDPAQYDRNAHTVVVQSLDEAIREIAQEEQEQEPRYIFNLPEHIDTMFAGRRGLVPGVAFPAGGAASPEGSQLVLYSGRPEEVISRALQGTKSACTEHSASREQDEEAMSISDAATERMELD